MTDPTDPRIDDVEGARADLQSWDWGTDNPHVRALMIEGADVVIDELAANPRCIFSFGDHPRLTYFPLGDNFSVEFDIDAIVMASRLTDSAPEDAAGFASVLRRWIDKFEDRQ